MLEFEVYLEFEVWILKFAFFPPPSIECEQGMQQLPFLFILHFACCVSLYAVNRSFEI